MFSPSVGGLPTESLLWHDSALALAVGAALSDVGALSSPMTELSGKWSISRDD